MNTHLDAEPRARGRTPLPAYGPIDALLGFAVFYVFVERATPTVVDVVTAALADVAPSLVRLGLAAALWFVLAATVLDQARRQLAALGVGSHDDVDRSERSRGAPTGLRWLGYLVASLAGGAVAAWTFEGAVATGISLIRAVAALDVAGVAPLEFVAMIVFFVAFGIATRSLDRLVVGTLRRILVGRPSE